MIKFVRKDDNTYLFDVETPLACQPNSVDCVVTDNIGNEYDLSALSIMERNWIISDTRTERSDLQYIINVCRPINIGTGIEKNCIGM